MSDEMSNQINCTVTVRPHQLLCIRCINGGCSDCGKDELAEVLARIKEDPDIHIRLTTSFDEIGARTDLFCAQNQMERKKDLDVLQKLGLVPGDIRTARVLFSRITEQISRIEDICGYNSHMDGKWTECPYARKEYFENGKDGIIIERSAEDKRNYKISSCEQIKKADHLYIRAHHLLCMTCFAGGKKSNESLEEDNLYELLEKIYENPDIPVTLVEGCSQCMVCPPCHAYDSKRGLCVIEGGLRDRKKDLDTFYYLGAEAGDTFTGKDLYRLIFDKIEDCARICDYDIKTASEWKACSGSNKYGAYHVGREQISKKLFS